MRYVADDSTIFWATGADSKVIAKRAEICGREIEMTVPFDGINSGEVQPPIIFFFLLLIFQSDFDLLFQHLTRSSRCLPVS